MKKYTKLEQLQFDRKIAELEEKIGGISTTKGLPQVVFVLDIRHDKTAVMEARKQGIKVYGICDTNVNPGLVDAVIPANDDSMASVSLISRLVAEAVTAGKAKQKDVAAKKREEAKAAEVAVTEDSKATIEELDLELNEKLAREKQETEKDAAPKRPAKRK